jgi:hypothetical protein
VVQESLDFHNRPTLDVNNLDFVVEYLDVEVTTLDESDNLREYLVAETLIITDTAEPYRRMLPGVIVIYLGHGDVELMTYPAGNGPQHLALSLEVHVLRNAQAELAYTDVHGINKRNTISNLSPARLSVKREKC